MQGSVDSIVLVEFNGRTPGDVRMHFFLTYTVQDPAEKYRFEVMTAKGTEDELMAQIKATYQGYLKSVRRKPQVSTD